MANIQIKFDKKMFLAFFSLKPSDHQGHTREQRLPVRLLERRQHLCEPHSHRERGHHPHRFLLPCGVGGKRGPAQSVQERHSVPPFAKKGAFSPLFSFLNWLNQKNGVILRLEIIKTNKKNKDMKRFLPLICLLLTCLNTRAKVVYVANATEFKDAINANSKADIQLTADIDITNLGMLDVTFGGHINGEGTRKNNFMW